jgi:hypothetical protein
LSSRQKVPSPRHPPRPLTNTSTDSV